MFMAALESMLHQTYRNIEIIVVMDEFNSGMEEILRYYREQDKRLRFYANNKNRGLPYSLNRGI